ncbi:MAG: NADP-dependent phosphogluconate dehydrogenase [Planctomycetota bacterium]|nr:NADP-dependent phosphogluconate dehydrogenase [Planctomycetota bacterium]
MTNEQKPADLGMIGLGVMGRNLALNLADHGYRVAVHDVQSASIDAFMTQQASESFEATGGGLVACASFQAMLHTLTSPRVIIVLVPAGKPVDSVCQSLIEAGIEPADLVVDGGNSKWTDTIRREKKYRGKLTFFGSGVSGGEVGARFGPSLMPGGDPEAWKTLQPYWEAIAAKVDPETGKPLEGASPGNPISGGEPCTTYIGADGAGHYVKMVHNGIEYADMQLIAEAYHLLRTFGNHSPDKIGDIFEDWNRGELDSYLMEITADILKQKDPRTGPRNETPLVDVILDAARMKGTGTWTAISALELGTPTMSITEAVFARGMSGLKEQRVLASKILKGPPPPPVVVDSDDSLVQDVRDAIYAAKVCAYAQGFQLMASAQEAYGWSLDFGSIAKIWRGGCIIRAGFLQKITRAYEGDPKLANLMLDAYFTQRLDEAQGGWRRIVARAALQGLPVPALSSALAYYDGYRTENLPANLIQAQRDYFGAHTYERVDEPRGKAFHLEWSGERGESEK